jgi:hypothetical protein
MLIKNLRILKPNVRPNGAGELRWIGTNSRPARMLNTFSPFINPIWKFPVIGRIEWLHVRSGNPGVVSD